MKKEATFEHDFVRISDEDFKDILIGLADEGEVYFEFEDQIKRAEIRYCDFLFNAVMCKHPDRDDVIFIPVPISNGRRRAFANKLVKEINKILKSKYNHDRKC